MLLEASPGPTLPTCFRLHDPHTSIDGVHQNARHFVFLIAVGGRHDQLRADLELLVFHDLQGAEFPATCRDRPHTLAP